LIIGRQLQKQPNKRSRKQFELEEKKINNLIINSKKQEFREIKRDLKMQEMNKRKEIKEQKKLQIIERSEKNKTTRNFNMNTFKIVKNVHRSDM